ncbi:peptide-methionine (S)-S-oxide reductase MsrA [Leptolyngbya sp. FACHB-321]|uniref:peptide-methionine (S)-S-oxide reductase MsrA n=1 Tax=Leptolyngbya sp. FACHB-321 TaxID=2692807 RepID=UPI0018EF7536|nr:peptide-methionine (S)-S-oxide reductase MsrA [Leptolyngbya sp. FACHB-321]
MAQSEVTQPNNGQASDGGTIGRNEPIIQPQFRTIDGLSIRYAESEDPGRGVHALLLSPWPESLYAFEPTWSRLAEHAHLVAVDLPGFGHSERRDALMSPRAMGEFVVRLADAFELEQPHVVGHDIGTSAALFAAALQPGQFRSLVVGSGGAAVPLQLGVVLKELVEAPDLEPYRRTDGRQFVTRAMGRIERAPSDIALEDYLSSYEGTRFAESMRYVRNFPTDLPVLGERLPSIRTPVLIIAGRRDPLVPLVNAEFLQEKLPASKLAVLDAGHYTWEEASDEYAAIVTGWWGGGYAVVGHLAGDLNEKNGATHPVTIDVQQAEVAVLAGGCFWGVEDILREVSGVIDTEVGYTGGWLENPTYKDTHDSQSGHAEAIRVTFDPSVLSFEELLDRWFFRLHDPTTLNRQGNDVGTQYRSAIFPQTEEQQAIAERVIAHVAASGRWKRPVTTSIEPAATWYSAEEYHQDYLRKHPGGYTCHYLRD